MASVSPPNVRLVAPAGLHLDFPHLLNFHFAGLRSAKFLEEKDISADKNVRPPLMLKLPALPQLPNIKPPKLPSLATPQMPTSKVIHELLQQQQQKVEIAQSKVVSLVQVKQAELGQQSKHMADHAAKVLDMVQVKQAELGQHSKHMADHAAKLWGQNSKHVVGRAAEVIDMAQVKQAELGQHSKHMADHAAKLWGQNSKHMVDHASKVWESIVSSINNGVGSLKRLHEAGEELKETEKSAQRQAHLCQQLYERGWDLERGCDPVAAAEVFGELSRLQPTAPNFVRYSKNLSDLVYLPELGKKVQLEAFSRAVEASTAAVSTDPTHVDAHISHCISQGRLALISDNKSKVHLAKAASDAAQVALDVDPKSDFAWHLMGRWHYEMAGINPFLRSLVGFFYGATLMPGTYPEAARHYRMAVQLNPTETLHRVGLGQALLKLGDTPGAVEAFDASTKMDVYDINAKYLVEEAKVILKSIRKSKSATKRWGLDMAAQQPSTTDQSGMVSKTSAKASSDVVDLGRTEATRVAVHPSSSADASPVVPSSSSTVAAVDMARSKPEQASVLETSEVSTSVTCDDGVRGSLPLLHQLSKLQAWASGRMQQHMKLPVPPQFIQPQSAAPKLQAEWPSAAADAPRPSQSEVRHQTAKGLKFQEAMDPEAAAAVFQDLAEKLPSSETLSHLSKNLSDMSFLPHLSRKQLRTANAKAINAAKAAVEADPTNAHAYLSLSLSQERLARYSDLPTKVQLLNAAVESAKDALELDPHSDLAHYIMGRLHYNMAEVHPAVRFLSGVLGGTRLQPTSYQDALVMFQTAAKLSPSRLIHQAELGRTMLKVGDPEAAMQHLESCLKLDVEGISDMRVKEDTRRLLDDLRSHQVPAALPVDSSTTSDGRK